MGQLPRKRRDRHRTAGPFVAASISVALLVAISAPKLTAAPAAPGSASAVGASPLRVQLRRIATVEEPTGVASRPGDATLYVLEKAGRIRAVRGTALDPTPLLDSTPVLDVTADTGTDNERGLLGLAFSPLDRALAYVTRTDRRGTLVLTEYRVDENGRFDASSARQVLAVTKTWNDHNGGSLAFDAEGLLYLGIGDGGGVGDGPRGRGDPDNNAQRLDRLLGKVLRIDPRRTEDGRAYAIPPGNPFADGRSPNAADRLAGKSVRPEIWAYGVRNPWRLSIDVVERRVWIPDVGQSKWEEINAISLATAGANLGWRQLEGRHPYLGGSRPKGAVDPVFEYAHGPARCAVIGGAVYRGSAIPELVGAYVFGDLCGGSMTALRPTGSTRAPWSAVDLGVGVAPLLGWGTGPDGELYATTRVGGVHRLERRS